MLIDNYFPKKPFRNFLDLDQKLNQYYDFLLDDVTEFDKLQLSPRFRFENGLKIGFRDIFYYIDRLYDNCPNSVIDVGCGECIWKNWFPNIIGFDPVEWPYGQKDFVDFFDKEFSHSHQENWDCGMALNSLHFVSWSDLPQQINQAMNIIKPGGKFLFTFNFAMIDRSTGRNDPLYTDQFDQKIKVMASIIENSGYRPIVVDFPTLRGIEQNLTDQYAGINGHARFVLEK